MMNNVVLNQGRNGGMGSAEWVGIPFQSDMGIKDISSLDDLMNGVTVSDLWNIGSSGQFY